MDLTFDNILIFWLLVQIKTILFWVYLWQLKDYHIGRFFAHFETFNGRRAILNVQNYAKAFLLGFALFVIFFYKALPIFIIEPVLDLIPFATALLYLVLGILAGVNLLFKNNASPKLNLKTIFLLMMSAGAFLALEDKIFNLVPAFKTPFLIQGSNFLALLAIDLVVPLLTSLVVLFFQPITVFLRTLIIWAAKIKRWQLKDLKVIGITGSYGKSTTKEILAHLLSLKYKTVKTFKNQNSEIGIASAILKNLKKDTQYFVCEMGAYNKGGIKFLCDIAKPQMGILTGINEQHLSTFGSFKNTISAKFELPRYLKKGEVAILNYSSKPVADSATSQKISANIIKIGSSGDVRYIINKVGIDFVDFNIQVKGQSANIKISLPGGEGLVQNAVLAVAAALECGIDFTQATSALALLGQEYSPYRLVKSQSGRDLVLATYSSNPESIKGALEYLKLFPKKKILVMPCLIELGQESKKIHTEIGKLIGEICDLAIITSFDHYQNIKARAMQSGLKPGKVIFMQDAKGIAKLIAQFSEPGDVIMLKGRVNQMIEKEAQQI